MGEPTDTENSAPPAVTLMLEGTVLPGQHRALEAFLREARGYYESIGDVHMRFMWSDRDEGRFREVFEYATEAAFHLDDDRTRQDPVMRGYLERWRSHIDGEITVTVWRDVDLG